jgi:hypothetical protein
MDLLTYYAMLLALGVIAGLFALYRERHPRKPPRP